jgi:hypothetical protein
VQVVEHEHERPRRCEPLEQRAHGAVAAVALVLERQLSPLCECRERRKDVGQLRAHVVGQGREARRIDALDVVVERIDEHGERQVALELRRRPAQDEVTASVRARRELPEQPRLADPGLADQLDRARATAIELVEGPLESLELVGTPDEARAKQGHGPPSRQG